MNEQQVSWWEWFDIHYRLRSFAGRILLIALWVLSIKLFLIANQYPEQYSGAATVLFFFSICIPAIPFFLTLGIARIARWLIKPQTF